MALGFRGLCLISILGFPWQRARYSRGHRNSSIKCFSPTEGIGPDVVVLAFLEEFDLLEGDFFVRGVFGFIESGEDDFVFAKFLVDGVDGGVEGGALDSWVEEARGYLFRF